MARRSGLMLGERVEVDVEVVLVPSPSSAARGKFHRYSNLPRPEAALTHLVLLQGGLQVLEVEVGPEHIGEDEL